jgi:CRISPR/Cas system-associated exonuclease Cas4 (RecB family)
MTGIQLLVDNHLREKQAERKTRESSHKFSPSSFGRCYRCQFLRQKGLDASNPPDVRTLRVFKSGNIAHEFIQSLFKDHQKEVLIETDEVKGYADVVLSGAVYDIKSCHSRKFWWLAKSGDIKEKEFTSILQLMTYVWLLNKEKGVLVYVSRDDLCINEYIFFLKDWKEHIQHELDMLRMYWDKQEMPPAQPRAYGGKEGKYCVYRDYCKNIERDSGRTITEHPCF